MNVSGTKHTSSNSEPTASTGGKTRLSGTQIIIARVVWLALVLPAVGLFVASLPVYYTFLQKACVGIVACSMTGALNARGIEELPSFGLSTGSYIARLVLDALPQRAACPTLDVAFSGAAHVKYYLDSNTTRLTFRFE